MPLDATRAQGEDKVDGGFESPQAGEVDERLLEAAGVRPEHQVVIEVIGILGDAVIPDVGRTVDASPAKRPVPISDSRVPPREINGTPARVK
jgi:hypothetical protein